MPRTIVLLGKHILSPLALTAAKPYLLLILRQDLHPLALRHDNTHDTSEPTAEMTVS